MGLEASNWAATSDGVAVAFGEQNFQNGQNYRIPAWMQVGVFRTFWVPAVRRARRHVLEYHL